MFYGCVNFDGDLSKWNTNNITSLQGTFQFCEQFKGNGLENWDVSNVITMNSLFYRCNNLTCDLSNWKVDKVKKMNKMFYECYNINFNLSKWNVSKVTNMAFMFNGCKNMECNGIDTWNPNTKTSRSTLEMFNNTKISNFPSWYKE